MLRPYAAVLRTPGALAFSGTGLLARVPMSMLGIGIVLLVSEVTGSYARAGLLSAVAIVAQAVASPGQARLVDRHGQSRVLVPLLALHATGMTLFLAGVVSGAGLSALVPAAAVAGACLPQFGALVRARWAGLHGGTAALHTAYSLESVLDEVVFVVGPVLVTVLAVGVHPLAGLGSALALTTGGGLLFAAQRSTQPPAHPRATGAGRDRLPAALLGWLVTAFVGMGVLFGAIEVVTVAFAEEVATRAAAGPVLAVFSLGSLVAGVVVGAVPARAPVRRRFLLGQAGLTTATLALPLVDSIPALALVAFACGLAISPTLIAGFSLIAAEVPAGRLTEGLAWASTALGAGVALGAAVSGAVVDAAGHSAGYGVAAGGGGLAVVAAVTGSLRRTHVRASVPA